MRLSQLLEQQDFRAPGIEIVCTYKTDLHEYAVLGRRGQPTFPGMGTTHLIEIAPDDRILKSLTTKNSLFDEDSG